MKRTLLLVAIAVAVVPGCRKKSSDDAAAAAAALPFFIPGAAGTRTIVARGGDGSTGAGGAGGAITFINSNAADSYLYRTGSIDTTFVIPSGTPTLGINPLVIAADTTMAVGTGLAAGVNTVLGQDGINPATGLWVQAGVTLTLGPNYDTNNADADADVSTGTKEQVNLAFLDTLRVDGTIRVQVKEGTLNSADLFITVATTLLSAGSLMDTSGVDGAGGTNGAGGQCWIEGNGTIRSEGQIISRGGDGDTGLAGGAVVLRSFLYSVTNSAPIDTTGGTGSTATGGNGGSVSLLPSANAGSFTGGGVFNTANVITRGGDGATGGGSGGSVATLDNDSDGNMVWTGDTDTSGGNATTNGNGGNAGANILDVVGGSLRATGSIVGRGGNGAGAGNGGNGGYCELASTNTGSLQTDTGTFLNVSIDVSGGNGAVGGAASNINIYNWVTYNGGVALPGTSPTVITGLTSVDTSGGIGATNGGNAGPINVQSNAVLDSAGICYYGNLRTEADLVTRGGDGGTGSGGNGGGIFIGETGSVGNQSAENFARWVVNTGALVTQGGAGGTTGGNGGGANVFSRLNARNGADIITSGGAGGTGNGGNGGSVGVRSDGQAINSGNFTCVGGNSTAAAGGGGGQTFVEGLYASHTGAISSNGGNGATFGGNGGAIEFGSWGGTAVSALSGTCTVIGGTGATAGGTGIVTVDGIRRALVAGSITF